MRRGGILRELPQPAWASVKENGDFTCIETHSGLRRVGLDPAGRQYLLSPGETEVSLGRALLDALKHSRVLSVREAREFFDHDAVERRYEEWVKDLILKYAYKSRRQLFRDMKNCEVECNANTITICPTHHDKLEGWGREEGDGIVDVVVPLNSGPQEIGAALRVALSRCR
jgi:hypothetical protein